MSTISHRLALASLPLVLLVAACSSSAGGASSAASTAASVAPSTAASEAPSEAPSAAASESPSEAPSAAGGDVSLALADTPLGKVLVDGKGMVLYLFTPDEAGQPTCYDACAEAWPPLTADAAPTAGAGLDASKITLVPRTDGTQQVKYGEYPLYYFAGDQAPGDTNGQGLNDKWYVIGADGEEIKGS